MRTIERAELLRIVEIGVRAISGYNGQPWRFRLRGDELDLYVTRTKNFFLKLEGVSYIEAGCALENLFAGARSLGFETVLIAQSCALGLDSPFATLKFRESVQEPNDGEYLLDRCTNRKPYDPTPPSAELCERIRQLSTDPNCEIVVSTEDAKDYLAQILGGLEKIRFANFYLMREVSEFCHFPKADAQRGAEWLDFRTLEIGPAKQAMLRWARKRWVHSLLNTLGLAALAVRGHRRLMGQSAAIITFLVQKREPRNFVELGRTIQRVLNFLSREGYQSMAVLSGLYLVDVLIENEEVFSPDEIRHVRYYQDCLTRFFAAPDKKPAFMARMGKAEPPSFRAQRRDVEQFLRNN